MAQSARKTVTPSRENALSLLKSDHEEVSELFAKYEKGVERSTAEQKTALAQQICEALTAHAQIEEEIFYPACHEHVEDAEDLLAEARVEHETLKELIAKIQKAKPGSEEFDAEVMVLGEYVKHHVKEEQNELFPKVRKSELDLNEVGEQLAARKEELQAVA
jgi:hemerythrin-like domain-containing protein